MAGDDMILSVDGVSKTYESGQVALKDVSLAIRRGEILALLGPNGAGKTTLISIICGLVNATTGTITVADHDISKDYRQARKMIGLVPQEIMLEPFERVAETIRFSRGLFGLGPDPEYLEQLLRTLTLWDKRNSITKELSGGMKRRCIIAKALAHRPRVLFLDEPSAGVDVELRKEMWEVVSRLKQDGVTIILTTHYIEEAEAIADRVGVISQGELLLVEEKALLMRRLGRRQMCLHLEEVIDAVPASLAQHALELSPDGSALQFNYDEQMGLDIATLLSDVTAAGFKVRDLETHQRSLEEIFVELVETGNGAP
ncbi:MAG: ABC transporter ATP-binding protein [Pseudomonadota bacterium]